jgi:hypothetical protein
MREIFIRFEKAYKYGMAFLFGFIIVTFLIRETDFYSNSYEIISELVVIFFCLRELREAYVRNRCKWQKGCIGGVLTHCILNIVYYLSNKNEEILTLQFLGLVIFLCIITFYYLTENNGYAA